MIWCSHVSASRHDRKIVTDDSEHKQVRLDVVPQFGHVAWLFLGQRGKRRIWGSIPPVEAIPDCFSNGTVGTHFPLEWYGEIHRLNRSSFIIKCVCELEIRHSLRIKINMRHRTGMILKVSHRQKDESKVKISRILLAFATSITGHY